MSTQSNFKLVNKSDLQRIHKETIAVLEQTGINFHSEEALEIFKKNGAKTKGQIVYISGEMLEKAINSIPKQFTWHAIDPQHNIQVGGEQDRVHIMLDHGSVNIQDIESGRRKSKMVDLIKLYKLGQASEVCNVIGQAPVDPSDADKKFKHLQITQQLLNHTNKPLMSYPVTTQTETADIFDMIEIVMGRGYLNNHPAVGVSVCALSPLQYAADSCETILAYAKRKQVLMTLTCAMSGVTAPIGLIGTAILQNAEILGGMVLSQLVNPGTPFVYSPASAVPNMKTAGYITGSPESNLINIVNLQLANELYHIPTRTMAGLTDAKTVDCQAGLETMQNYFTLMMSGTHMINECIGTLDSILTVSYEKFMIDEEMMSRMLRIMEGVSTTDADFDITSIQKIGQTGTYLTQPDTIKNCRSTWVPTVSDWDSYDKWEAMGSEDIVVRANRKYKEVLKNCPESLLRDDVAEQLANFVNSRRV